MVAVYYTKYNTKYTIELCTYDNIDSDYNVIKDLVDDADEAKYKLNMKIGVKQKLAMRVHCDDQLVGFMYTKLVKVSGVGCSIWGKDTRGMLLLLKELFNNYPSHKLVVMPHKGDATYIKSLTTGYSIRNFRNKNTPLVVMIKDVREQVERLYSRLGVK